MGQDPTDLAGALLFTPPAESGRLSPFPGIARALKTERRASTSAPRPVNSAARVCQLGEHREESIDVRVRVVEVGRHPDG